MIRLFIALACILLLITTTSAQQVPVTKFSLSGGLSMPTGPSDFTTYWNTGFNFGLGVSRSIGPVAELRVNLDVNNFGLDGEKLLAAAGGAGSGFVISGGSITTISVVADVKLTMQNSPSIVHPYLAGGIGYFHISFGDMTIAGGGMSAVGRGTSESDAALNLNGGLDIATSEETTLFIQAGYMVGFTKSESTTYIPIKAGVAFRL